MLTVYSGNKIARVEQYVSTPLWHHFCPIGQFTNHSNWYNWNLTWCIFISARV